MLYVLPWNIFKASSENQLLVYHVGRSRVVFDNVEILPNTENK